MIFQSGVFFHQHPDELLIGFHPEQFAVGIDSEPVVDGLKIEIFFVHLTEKFPSGLVAQAVFTAMFISESALEADVTIRPLAKET